MGNKPQRKGVINRERAKNARPQQEPTQNGKLNGKGK